MDISSNEVTDDLVSACKEHSSRIAIDGEGVSVSYGNLLAEATRLGQRLRESGAGESTSVMVKCSNHPSDFVALLGYGLLELRRFLFSHFPAGCRGWYSGQSAMRGSDRYAGGTMANVLYLVGAMRTPNGRKKALAPKAALVIFTSGSTGQPKGAVISHSAFRGSYGRTLDCLNQQSTQFRYLC